MLLLELHSLIVGMDPQQAEAINPGVSAGSGLIGYVLMVVALWPVFSKAGRPGWGALIPIYNIYLLVKVAGLHGALTLLYFIPIVNVVVALVVALRIGRNFGKGALFSVFLLWIFSLIGFLILGYGSSQYRGANAA